MISLQDILFEDIFKIDLKVKPYEKLIIDAVISFMKNKYGFKSKVIVKKKANENLFGDIVLNNNTLKKDKFYLHYNPNNSYSKQIKSLIHELTHVKQISKKELRPSKDYKKLLWKGKEVITVKEYKKLGRKDIKEYKKLPWEREAYENMDKLYKPFLNSTYWEELKGKDPNLDYIIQNI